MDIKEKISEIGLNSENSVVIGSGILNALGLRESKDIDVVVTEKKYNEFFDDNRFKKEQNHGHEVLSDGLFEILKNWTVLGKTWKFRDLMNCSVVKNDVRYVTVEFLLDVKRHWLKDKDIRQKDMDDVKLIENYLSFQKKH